MTDVVQDALFAPPVDPEPAALPYTTGDMTPLAVALRGDGYRWLTGILPAPVPVRCTAHRTLMRLAEDGLLWVCSRCDAEAIPADPGSGDAGAVAA